MRNLVWGLSVLAATAAGPCRPVTAADWPMFGQNLANTASSPAETAITPANVHTLAPKWVATTGGPVTARSAVVNGIVYFPDYGGNIWALNALTGATVWHHKITDYGNDVGFFSRTSPTVVNGTLYIGTYFGATLLAIDAATGALKWKIKLETHPQAVLTASPAVYNGILYTGVSSIEEDAASDPKYPCCSFHGSVVAVDAATGQIGWRAVMSPPGYAGVGVWGSNPVVDARRNAIYVGTGDNDMTPTDPAYQLCISYGGAESTCMSRDNHVDSVVALDMTTGKVKWAARRTQGDDFNLACETKAPGVGNCPRNVGKDYDFGAGPNLFNVRLPDSLGVITVVGAGQKSGVYSAFFADTGKPLWATHVGPGSEFGGIQWGTATDNRAIYVAISNASHRTSAAGRAGSWAALDLLTGRILWQAPDPNGAPDIGPMTVADGVVYAPSIGAGANQANMFALDARSGKTLWQYNSGGSVSAGAVISGGMVYWGSGSLPLGPGFKGNNKFYAFSLGGK